jgi:hypothetical protein
MASNWEYIGAITATSPATASTAATTDTIKDICEYEWFLLIAELQGATGGTLDVYIQGKMADTWYDWGHFIQIAAGGAAVKYMVQPQANNGAVAIGSGTSPVIAADTFLGGYPGDEIRLVFTAGASTSAGAAQTVKLYGRR